MTAEIAIMNKQGIALAADSAVTMSDRSGQKIFPSANKIFSLSKYHPVGIMVYGNASFMGVPWETVIKMYRSRLGEQHFPSLRLYADDFLSFLRTEPTIANESFQETYAATSIMSYFINLVNLIRKAADEKICGGIELTKAATARLVSRVIKQEHEEWTKTPSIEDLPQDYKRDLKKRYGEVIEKCKKDVFEQLPMFKKTSRLLTNLAIELFTRFPPQMYHTGISGVVIAGFGTNDVFPCLVSFFVDGIAANALRYAKENDVGLGIEVHARIVPFAQKEMVVRFIDGVDPFYEGNIEAIIAEILYKYPQVILDSIDILTHDQKRELNEKLVADIAHEELEKVKKRLTGFRKDNFSNPVLKVVTMLPKDGLALMAQSLVSLTSFKRKMTMEAETVGEPIDVAVISKGDGFTWIKRKRYFPAELNQPFFDNYFREIRHEKKSERKKKSI